MPATPSAEEPVRVLAPGMRVLLWAAGVLVFLAGVQLFVFSERTERYFAWTVDPPVTAAFLGAAYWSSVTFEWAAARSRTWAGARIAVPTVFVFTALTLVVTLVHLDRFHLESSHQGATRAVTWAWIAVYVTVPVLLAVLWWRQHGVPGTDPPRGRPLARWLQVLVAAQAVVFLVVGVALLLAPTDAARAWPWALTPLTGRAIGAWGLGLGVAAVHALWEGDADRLRPAAFAYLVFGVLQGVTLLRYPDVPDWGEPETALYVAVLASAVLSGVATLRSARSAPRPGSDRRPAPRPTAA